MPVDPVSAFIEFSIKMGTGQHDVLPDFNNSVDLNTGNVTSYHYPYYFWPSQLSLSLGKLSIDDYRKFWFVSDKGKIYPSASVDEKKYKPFLMDFNPKVYGYLSIPMIASTKWTESYISGIVSGIRKTCIANGSMTDSSFLLVHNWWCIVRYKGHWYEFDGDKFLNKMEAQMVADNESGFLAQILEYLKKDPGFSSFIAPPVVLPPGANSSSSSSSSYPPGNETQKAGLSLGVMALLGVALLLILKSKK
jgi:hypothetical protein